MVLDSGMLQIIFCKLFLNCTYIDLSGFVAERKEIEKE
jgi:hypothetical protein